MYYNIIHTCKKPLCYDPPSTLEYKAIIELQISINNLEVTFQPDPPPRPKTAKPRDPDSYEFADEQLEKDYRNMYDKLQALEEAAAEANKQASGGEGAVEDKKELLKEMEAALVFNDVNVKK